MAKLTDKQYAAIALLSLPKRGGLTFAEVAERVGVSDRALRTWRNDDKFNNELKAQVMRNSIDDLPDIVASFKTHIVEQGNAALARTFMQALGMLQERVEVTTDNKGTDMEALKAEILRMKGGE